MFFPRLRRQAKWAFAFMVLVFAGSFVFLGVGSGSGGIGDLLQGNFGDLFGGSSGPSIGKAQDRVREHPNDAAAYRALATAYGAKNRDEEAIRALQRYVSLRPKDAAALEELASLQLRRANDVAARRDAAQAELVAADPAQLIRPAPTSKLGQAIGTDPIAQAASADAQARYDTLARSAQTAYGDAVASYKKLAARQADSATVQEELGLAALQANDATTALSAFRRYLRLAPDGSDAPVIKQYVNQLEAQAAASTGGG